MLGPEQLMTCVKMRIFSTEVCSPDFVFWVFHYHLLSNVKCQTNGHASPFYTWTQASPSLRAWPTNALGCQYNISSAYISKMVLMQRLLCITSTTTTPKHQPPEQPQAQAQAQPQPQPQPQAPAPQSQSQQQQRNNNNNNYDHNHKLLWSIKF